MEKEIERLRDIINNTQKSLDKILSNDLNVKEIKKIERCLFIITKNFQND